MSASALLLVLAALPLAAQTSSSIRFRAEGEQQRVSIHNVSYHLAGEGRVLRKTVDIDHVAGDKGMEAKVRIEAFPLASKLAGKPLYSISLTGVDAGVLEGEVIRFERGTEDVDWWTIHRLADGRRLFDTYVPLLVFSPSREAYTPRYAGLLVPPDDDPDAKLRDPKLVAVIEYASAEKLLREVKITCGDTRRAGLLRSYSDQTRTLTLLESPPALQVSFRSNYPDPPSRTDVVVPVAKDTLDVARAHVPAGLRLE